MIHSSVLPVVASASTPSVSSMLGDLTTITTSVVSGVVTMANTILGNPLLLLSVGIFFAGGLVGILGRLLSRN